MIKLLENYNVISIIGMGKNVGKTSVLNYILSNLDDNLVIGITSIGYDGEEHDTITNRKKPNISLKENDLFASTTEALKQSKIKYEILEYTNMHSPLGEIVIARALNKGTVLLAGPSRKSALKEIIKRFSQYKVHKIFIDGAFGKMMQSDAYIADATILSTGLAYSANINTLVEETAFRASLYSNKSLYQSQIDIKEKTIYLDSVLGNEREVIKKLKANALVFIDGALTDRLIKEIIYNYPELINITFILNNPTMSFVSAKLANAALKKNIKILFKETTTLLALTINPTSPKGDIVDSDELKQKFSKILDIPIFDIMKEKGE